MAACEVTIELEDPSRVYCDGESIRGEVVVSVTQETNCNGLIVSTGWATHGRGNIDQGEVESSEVFSGIWQPGTDYRYAFELATAEWPPTYYGTLLNVSHQVHVRAKLPWAFDAKAAAEFPVTATHSPDDLAPQRNETAKSWGLFGMVFGGAVIAVLIALLSAALIFLLPILLIVAGLFWFFTSYLPKSITGKVECVVEPLRLKAGQAIRGTMEFTPKRESKINGVRYTVSCQEVCVSGSGSNRTTHDHEVLSFSGSLYDQDTLLSAQPLAFDFEYSIPQDAAPSLDLSDNDVKWQVEFRVDIPRWPDFARKIDLIVEPSGNTETVAAAVGDHRMPEESWLAQVNDQLEISANSTEQLELVLEAVRDHQFEVTLSVDQPTGRPIQAEHIHGGTWLEAYAEEPDTDFLLHCDGRQGDPHEKSDWTGKVAIIGYVAGSGEVIATVVG